MPRRADPTRCPECGRKYKTNGDDNGAKKDEGPATIRLSTLGIIALIIGLIWFFYTVNQNHYSESTRFSNGADAGYDIR